MAGTFEEVIVQKEPAWPVYAEQSFMTWSFPCPPEDAEAAPNVMATEPAIRRSVKKVRVRITFINLLLIESCLHLKHEPVPKGRSNTPSTVSRWGRRCSLPVTMAIHAGSI